MNNSHPYFQPNTQVGDYVLESCIFCSEMTTAWYARQISIGREVIFEILNPEHNNSPEFVESFHNNIRAKASIHLPHVSSIYESGESNGVYFFTRELLAGKNLQELLNLKVKLMPNELARTLKTIAETQRRIIASNLNTLELDLTHIFRDERGVTRLENISIEGAVDPLAERRDIAMLGNILPELLREGAPGATRFLTMCSWMGDKTRNVPLAWLDVQDLCETIESQLTRTIDPNATNPQPIPPKKTFSKWLKKNWPITTSVIGGVAAISALVLTLYFKDRQNSQPVNQPTPAPKTITQQKPLHQDILIPAGKVTSLNNQVNPKVPAFSIDAYEVTIEAYALFLKDMSQPEILKGKGLDKLLTSGKKSFEPGDWDNQLKAAQNGSKWNGNVLSLRSPVVNVDLIDARAYAIWSGRRLPSADEWLLASEANFSQAKPDSSLDVDTVIRDKTSNFSHGYAGRVKEWVEGKEFDPALPAEDKKYIILGGSISGGSAKDKLFVGNNLTRRADVGFRTVKK